MSSRKFFVNLVVALLPSTRLFSLKRKLWRACGVELGDGVKINAGARTFGSGSVKLGDDTWLGLDCILIAPADSCVSIGHQCDLAPGVLVDCGSHIIGGKERRAGEGTASSVTVGSGTWIGARVTLLAGAHVGTGSVVAAGAVVRAGNYPNNALLAGVPARLVRQLHDEEEV